MACGWAAKCHIVSGAVSGAVAAFSSRQLIELMQWIGEESKSPGQYENS
jgi:hypothetical protein